MQFVSTSGLGMGTRLTNDQLPQEARAELHSGCRLQSMNSSRGKLLVHDAFAGNHPCLLDHPSESLARGIDIDNMGDVG